MGLSYRICKHPHFTRSTSESAHLHFTRGLAALFNMHMKSNRRGSWKVHSVHSTFLTRLVYTNAQFMN